MLKVAVFNTYLGTWGGGERSTYANAAAFAAQGFEVEVVSFEEHLPSADEIERFFGPGLTGFRLRQVSAPEAEREAALRAYLEDKTIFVNHCAGSAFVNPCPLGIYVVMFPFQEGGAWVKSYHHFLCNSDYTRAHTLQRWGPGLSTQTVYPAAGDTYLAASQRTLDILTIGRFNWQGHAKNQDAMVEAFADIVDLLPPGWRLLLMGKLNSLPDNLVAMEELKRRCRRLPITFEVNVSEDRKRQLLSSATLYWHGTGVGRSEPHEMEHFGISIVESMRAGVVPLCFNRGGPVEIVEHGKSGFLYRDLEELKAYTLALVARESFRQAMSRNSVERAHAFDRPSFDRRMAEFVRSVVAA